MNTFKVPSDFPPWDNFIESIFNTIPPWKNKVDKQFNPYVYANINIMAWNSIYEHITTRTQLRDVNNTSFTYNHLEAAWNNL